MDISKNAKFALVIFEQPAEGLYGKEPEGRWKEFLINGPNNKPTPAGTLRIHENVWLINLDKNMLLLTELYGLSRQRGIRSHILFLSERPDWIKYPPDA